MFFSNGFPRVLLLVAISLTSAITLAQSPETSLTQNHKASTTAKAATIVTEAGAISGVRDGGLSVYKGVPFAAPPVGDLRWRAPAPVAHWTGTRKADEIGRASC